MFLPVGANENALLASVSFTVEGLIAWLGLARSEVGDDGSHVSWLLVIVAFWDYSSVWELFERKWPKSVSHWQSRSLRYDTVQQVEERIGFCFFASKSRSINYHHENLSDDHRAKAQRSGECL